MNIVQYLIYLFWQIHTIKGVLFLNPIIVFLEFKEFCYLKNYINLIAGFK